MRRILAAVLGLMLCISLSACSVTSDSNIQRVIKNRYGYDTVVTGSQDYVDVVRNTEGILYQMTYQKDGKDYPFEFFLRREYEADDLTPEQEEVLKNPEATEEEIKALNLKAPKERYEYDYDTFEAALFSAWLDSYVKDHPLTQFASENNLWFMQIQSPEDIEVARKEYIQVASALIQDEEMSKLVYSQFEVKSADPATEGYMLAVAPWSVQTGIDVLEDQFDYYIMPNYAVSMYNLGTDLSDAPAYLTDFLDTLEKDSYTLTLGDKSVNFSLVARSPIPIARIPEFFDTLGVEYSGDYSKFSFSLGDGVVFAGTSVMLDEQMWAVTDESGGPAVSIDNAWVGTSPAITPGDFLHSFLPEATLTCNGVEVSPSSYE